VPVKVKAPVPDADAQAKAEKLIREVFKAEYSRTRSADLIRLAEKLLERAQLTIEEPAQRFVLLREATSLAARGGNIDLALQAITEMERDYAIEDALDQKLAALDKVNKQVSIGPSSKKAVIENALVVVDEAVAADNFDLAIKLVDLADVAARKIANPPLIKRVQGRAKELAEQRKDYEKIEEALETLKKQPKDAEANLTVGKYLCLTKGDWDKGLPRLALGSDGTLQALARKEAAKPTTAAARTDLADGWWDLAAGERGPAKPHLQRRAYYWYKLAIADLMGLQKEKVEQRLRALSEQLPERPGHWDHLDVANATPMSGFLRINRNRSIGTKQTYTGPIEITVELRTEKDAVRLNAPPGAGVVFNSDPTNAALLLLFLPDGGLKPESGTRTLRVAKPLAPNTWYTIRWKITENGMEVLVNDVTYYRDKRKYDLTIESPVRVRAANSFVDVKSLVVQPIQQQQ
jgi:hypothetical protein